MSKQSQPRCIIVGAGVAGMSAAMHCLRFNIQPIVLESKAYIGGRAHSFVENHTHEVIDNGQHLMMGCYTEFLDLLRELRTTHLLRSQRSLKVAFMDRRAHRSVFAARWFRGTAGVVEALLRYSTLTLRSKYRAALFMVRVRRMGPEVESLSAQDLLNRSGQTPEVIHSFWEPFVLATCNAPLAHTSAALLVEVLKRSVLAGGDSSSLLLPQSGLSELFQPFPHYLKEYGGELHLGTRAQELIMLDGQCVGVSTEDQQEVRGQSVIIAVPFRELQRLESPAQPLVPSESGMLGLNHSAIISIYLWFDRDFVNDEFCALLGSTTQWVFNRRKMCVCSEELRAQYPGHVALTISAAGQLTELGSEALVQRVLADLHAAFPDSRHAQLMHSKVVKERFATILADEASARKRPPATTLVRNVFIAGDWTRTGLPATLEGAAQSGAEAARRAADYEWKRNDSSTVAPTIIHGIEQQL